MSRSQESKGRNRRSDPVFTVANPDAKLSDEAIDALARLLLSLKQQLVEKREKLAA
jgi:hypothetical protein